MENYAMIEGRKVKLSNKTVESLKEALSIEQTYKPGAVFTSDNYLDCPILLVQSEEDKCCMTTLYGSYGMWESSIKVSNTEKITKKEINTLMRPWCYWTYIGQFADLYERK